jgi:hypothetical protein
LSPMRIESPSEGPSSSASSVPDATIRPTGEDAPGLRSCASRPAHPSANRMRALPNGRACSWATPIVRRTPDRARLGRALSRRSRSPLSGRSLDECTRRAGLPSAPEGSHAGGGRVAGGPRLKG